MGRPLNSRLFGADANNNLKVQFNNGEASVPGYIVKQYGSERFKCRDADGNTAICKMVAKASADLEEGEMSITVKNDLGEAHQLTKIFEKVVSVAGRRVPWTFDPSTTDARVQFEEAGTDTDLTGADDFEGDEGPTIPDGMDPNEPLAGSGGSNNNVPGTFTATNGYVDAFDATGMTYRNISASALDTVPGTPVDGLYRRKYVGNWSETYIDEANYEFDVGFMKPANGPISQPAYEVDTYGGFGLRTDLDAENGYAFEWKGYIQAPATGNFNFFATVDDDCISWIGAPATATTLSDSPSDYLFAQSGNTRNNASVGVAMTANKWYPIRIWFQEWGGAEKFQFGASCSANATRYGLGGTNFAFKHNSVTKGY